MYVHALANVYVCCTLFTVVDHHLTFQRLDRCTMVGGHKMNKFAIAVYFLSHYCTPTQAGIGIYMN